MRGWPGYRFYSRAAAEYPTSCCRDPQSHPPFCGFVPSRLCVLLFISAPSCTTQSRPELKVQSFRCSSARSFLSLLLITTAHLASLPVASCTAVA